MRNDRHSELALLNLKVTYDRKAQVLQEALSELSQNLFGLDSPDSYIHRIHSKMQRDCSLAKAVRGETRSAYGEIMKLLELIEVRAQLKEWNVPLALIGR